ncbi:MAG: RNA polymerase sigma factor [Pyrinomonadaceae bacterium]|nr:RNA polymerase sigma factor [Pyrinomonadaceae bacterium]
MTVLATTPSDDELLRRIIAGEEDAFVALYRRRSGGIYRFALHMCGSEAIAEDVTQEVFMALMRDIKKFDSSRGSLAAYLYGIARHHVLRQLARDRAFVPMMNGDETETSACELLAAPDDPLGDLTRRETVGRVREAVLALPAHYREVVVLCELHEMSYVDAATALGCAVGTVRSRLHRGRAMLIERLRAAEQPRTDAHTIKTARCFA